jgi:SAM-dependent methyltransferase
MIDVFEKSAREYDGWFDQNKLVYQSELLAIKAFLPPEGFGLEIGVGTGRFAAPLGIAVGVEPARAMAKIARNRGIKVCQADAAELPFGKGLFDFVVMVTVLCFLKDPGRALMEAERVIKAPGKLIIGMIDPDTPLGRSYEKKKAENKFYRQARFYPVRLILEWLKKLGFGNLATCQTIFPELSSLTEMEPLRENHGQGGFVVIAAQKI